MRSFILVALVCAVAASQPPVRVSAQQPDAQTPIFRGAARIVPVITTVLDGDGRLVPGLEKEDFSIFDNGASNGRLAGNLLRKGSILPALPCIY